MSRVVVLVLTLSPLVAAGPVTLTATPAPAPRNLYRWQLLPDLLTQKAGDAIEDYKKATAALKEVEPDREAFGVLSQELEKIRTAPLPDLDRKRVAELVAKFQKPLDLIHQAARREQVNWDFVTERLRKAGIGALLGEVQEVRDFLPWLALHARHHLLEGRPEEAVKVVGTVFSLARQVNECPTLIAHLVGIACAQIGLDLLQDCVQHPKCPSLYGPLTDLPRPFLTPRLAYEGERIAAIGTIPGLSKLVADPTAELSNETVDLIVRVYNGLTRDEPGRPATRALDRVTLALAMQKKHDLARAALQAAGYDAAVIAKTPIRNAGLLHGLLQYEEVLGHMAAAALLPYPQARIQFVEIAKKYPERKPSEAADDAAFPLVRIFLPHGSKILLSDLRLQRRLELLRAAEGLRQHAASAGKWPAKLDDVKIVPLPHDPATGKPFAYRIEKDVAILEAPLPQPDANKDHALEMRLTLRKAEEKKP